MPAFIADGYTETRTIPAVEGIYEEVELTYRPMSALDRAELYQGWAGLSVTNRIKRRADFIAKHVKKWNLVMANPDAGEGTSETVPVPLTSAYACRLDDNLMDAIMALLMPTPKEQEADAKN